MPDVPTDRQLLGAGAPPFEVTARDGRVFKVGPPLEAARVALADAVREHARQALLATKDPTANAVWFDRVEAGEYDTFGPGWTRITRNRGAAHLFLYSLMKPHHPDLRPADVAALQKAEPEQCKAAVLAWVPDFFAHLAAWWAEESQAPPAETARVAAESKAATVALLAPLLPTS